jgi:hypothetical protein
MICLSWCYGCPLFSQRAVSSEHLCLAGKSSAGNLAEQRCETDAASEGSHSAVAAVLRRSSPRFFKNHHLDSIAAQSDRVGCSTLRRIRMASIKASVVLPHWFLF